MAEIEYSYTEAPAGYGEWLPHLYCSIKCVRAAGAQRWFRFDNTRDAGRYFASQSHRCLACRGPLPKVDAELLPFVSATPT